MAQLEKNTKQRSIKYRINNITISVHVPSQSCFLKISLTSKRHKIFKQKKNKGAQFKYFQNKRPCGVHGNGIFTASFWSYKHDL